MSRSSVSRSSVTRFGARLSAALAVALLITSAVIVASTSPLPSGGLPSDDVPSGEAPALAAGDAPRFPIRVTTIDGEVIDVAALARRTTLVIVTLKAPGCPVCQRQLERIKQQRDYLADCGVSFLVLAPGPADQAREEAIATCGRLWQAYGGG